MCAVRPLQLYTATSKVFKLSVHVYITVSFSRGQYLFIFNHLLFVELYIILTSSQRTKKIVLCKSKLNALHSGHKWRLLP